MTRFKLPALRSLVLVSGFMALAFAATPLQGTAHADGYDAYGWDANQSMLYSVPHCGGVIFMAPPSDDIVSQAGYSSNALGGWLCSDAQYYRQGQVVTICYDVPWPGTFVDLELRLPSGQQETLAYGYDDGTGGCFAGRARGRGWRTASLSFGGRPSILRYNVR